MLLAAALTVLQTVVLEGPLHHVQGIDVEGDVLWVSSVDRQSQTGFLFRMDRRTGKMLAKAEVQDGGRYHPGGLTLDGDSVWLPVAEYRRLSSTVIQRRDKRTLRLLSQFEVADHIGCVAASRDRLYGGNWDSIHIYEWDKDGRLLSKRRNASGNRYQDLKFLRGRLLGGGILGEGKGAIDWLDPATLRLARRMEVATTSRSVVFTNEGMTLRSGYLYLLPEDDPSRLFVARAP